MNREQQLADAFVDLTDTLSGDVEPLTLLHRLAEHCRGLTCMDAAGVLLANARGGLRSAAVSADRREFETALQTAEGPGAEAFMTGAHVHTVDIGGHEPDWPRFVSLARAAGCSAAYALPLRAGGQTVGAVHLLARAPVIPDSSQSVVLQALADVTATAVVTWNRDLPRPYDIVTRTQAALSSKALLDTAAGMIAATADISPREAAGRLRAYAARSHQRPTAVADRLVKRQLTPQSVLTETS
ncbi:GAF and ANTAR domain-containing protein [Streptomyces sp. NPDC059499]|uniref:GAF and ANTAR domain-containing protein n=1 Tax=Streptomyces sp. NPDC059499 TaxID=3346852 RepID=UPI003690A2D8